MSDLKPFVLDFDLLTGHCDSGKVQPSCRRVSNLLTQFADEEAAKKLIAEGDPLLYEFYELELPEEPGVLRFGSTRLYPGKVGNEYFMTKGHYHARRDTAEYYFCIAGQGALILMREDGTCWMEQMQRGSLHYIERSVAHRLANTGDEPLVVGCCWGSDIGHDYESIARTGFTKRLIERDGKAILT